MVKNKDKIPIINSGFLSLPILPQIGIIKLNNITVKYIKNTVGKNNAIT